MLTYSRANKSIISSRQEFVDAVLIAFQLSGNGAQVLQHVCAQERHSDGGIHYHMAVKLDRCQRWLHVRNRLQEDKGIRVHFSSRHCNYYAASCRYLYPIRFMTRLMVLSETCVRPHTVRSLAAVKVPSVLRR